MIRRLRWILPPLLFVVVYAIVFGVMSSLELLCAWLPVDVDTNTHVPRGATVLLGAAAFGAYRVVAFHPEFSPSYHHWLLSTPWTPGRRLPLAPVHLTIADVLVIAVFAALGYGNHYATPMHCVLAYVGANLATLGILFALTGEVRYYAYVIVFGLGLVLRLYGHGIAPMVALVAVYVLAHVGLRKSFAGLRHERRIGDLTVHGIGSQLVSREASGLKPTRTAGYPYDELLKCSTEPMISVVHALALSLMAAWLTYLGVFVDTGGEPQQQLNLILLLFPISGPLVRIGAYCLSYHPPVSLWGRIRTGTFLIPDYDYALVAPLTSAATGLIVWWCLPAAGVPVTLAGSATAFATMLPLLAMGPTMGSWRLVGRHRAIAFGGAGKGLIRI